MCDVGAKRKVGGGLLVITVILLYASLAFSGLDLWMAWDLGAYAPIQVQYATTPTSTWKTLGVWPNGIVHSPPDNNVISRGRYYYFRARHVFDNGSVTPWSKYVGVCWLTGTGPDNTYLQSKTDNAIILIRGK